MINGLRFGNEVANALKVIRREKEEYKDIVSQRADDAGQRLVKALRSVWKDITEEIIELLIQEIPLEQPNVAVWWYSVLIGISKDAVLFQKMVFYISQNRKSFSPNTQFFLYYQLKSLQFRFLKLDDDSSKKEIWNFYKEIVEEFADRTSVSLERIPISKRKEKLVLVITEQFLSVQHGPTKTALDRCKILIENMGKEVLLINTAEVLTQVGAIPFFDTELGNYFPEKMQEKEQIWKGCYVPYYQCAPIMPNRQELDGLLTKIREMTPGYVVVIGGSSILANLVNKMIPVVCIGLGPSGLECTTVRYQTLSRKVSEKDRHLLSSLGFLENHVIESIFTSSLKPQSEKITRKELGEGLEGKFLLVIVGARLDDEITEDFLEMLNKIIEPNMWIGFLGYFNKYEQYLGKWSKLKKQSSYFGFCKDILSRLEVCDLYINPKRKGGGTSSVEALFKGVPVVSIDYGDVAVNVGEEFCVKDYQEMQQKILHYYKDKNYYKFMSEKAMKRAEILLDTETEFVRIMTEVDRRERMEEENEGI